VAVAARDRHARLREAQLRADDVHDALLRRAEVVTADAEVAAVALEGDEHLLGHRVERRARATLSSA
jgi:hypothetical protein